MGYGKMEGEADDRIMAYMIERDSADGPVYHQEWLGMRPTTPIISGGMNALRLPGFFKNLGHGNLINSHPRAFASAFDGRLQVIRPHRLHDDEQKRRRAAELEHTGDSEQWSELPPRRRQDHVAVAERGNSDAREIEAFAEVGHQSMPLKEERPDRGLREMGG